MPRMIKKYNDFGFASNDASLAGARIITEAHDDTSPYQKVVGFLYLPPKVFGRSTSFAVAFGKMVKRIKCDNGLMYPKFLKNLDNYRHQFEKISRGGGSPSKKSADRV